MMKAKHSLLLLTAGVLACLGGTAVTSCKTQSDAQVAEKPRLKQCYYECVYIKPEKADTNIFVDTLHFQYDERGVCLVTGYRYGHMDYRYQGGDTLVVNCYDESDSLTRIFSLALDSAGYGTFKNNQLLGKGILRYDKPYTAREEHDYSYDAQHRIRQRVDRYYEEDTDTMLWGTINQYCYNEEGLLDSVVHRFLNSRGEIRVNEDTPLSSIHAYFHSSQTKAPFQVGHLVLTPLSGVLDVMDDSCMPDSVIAGWNMRHDPQAFLVYDTYEFKHDDRQVLSEIIHRYFFGTPDNRPDRGYGRYYGFVYE